MIGSVSADRSSGSRAKRVAWLAAAGGGCVIRLSLFYRAKLGKASQKGGTCDPPSETCPIVQPSRLLADTMSCACFTLERRRSAVFLRANSKPERLHDRSAA